MNIHADLIEQYAQDWKETIRPWERWEFLSVSGEWKPMLSHPDWVQSYQYRRKPRTFMVGDVEVRPVQEALRDGKHYFVACPALFEHHMAATWRGMASDGFRLKRGLIHLNKEDAIAHGKALAALTGGE